MADVEHAIPVTQTTIFEAGSIAKQFTAAAILLLVDEGRISLSDDVREYVPELPDYTALRSRSITFSPTRAGCATGAP